VRIIIFSFLSLIVFSFFRIRSFLKNTDGADYVDLIVSFEASDGSEANGPTVRYWLNN